MAVIDYSASTIPSHALAGYAFERGLGLDEAQLRLRAVFQMCAHRPTPDGDDGRTLRARIDDVDRLTGVRPVPLGGSLHTYATFLAVQFYDGDNDDGEVRRIRGSWWATPLGALCDRVLHLRG